MGVVVAAAVNGPIDVPLGERSLSRDSAEDRGHAVEPYHGGGYYVARRYNQGLLRGRPVVSIGRHVAFAGEVLSDGDLRCDNGGGELDALEEVREALELSASAAALAAIGSRHAAVLNAVDDGVVLDSLLVMTVGIERERAARGNYAEVERG